MKYGYTIIYVSSVEETLEFYKKAFGFNVKFIHESKADLTPKNWKRG